MKKYILILFLLLPIPSHADVDWWMTVSNATLIVDWGQTLNIDEKYNETLSFCSQYTGDQPCVPVYETNPILGEHPSRGKINLYFAGWIAFNTYLNKEVLKGGWKSGWNGLVIGMELKVINENLQIGLRGNF